jgi:hypothetical protein
VESDLIIEYLNYINQTYFSCVQCFINGKEVECVESMVFDAKGQTKEGGMQVCLVGCHPSISKLFGAKFHYNLAWDIHFKGGGRVQQ